MQCPNTFNLPPPLDPDRFPPPSPPKFLKHQVYENTDVFNKVDQHAIQVIRIPLKYFKCFTSVQASMYCFFYTLCLFPLRRNFFA